MSEYENLRTISGHVTISNQLLQQALDDEEAIRQWEKRMNSDPEYAAEWYRQVAREDEQRDPVRDRVQQIVSNYDALDYRKKRAVNIAEIIHQLREALEAA